MRRGHAASPCLCASRPEKPSHVYDDLIVNNMINISCPRSVCTFQPESVISETRVLVEQEGGGEVNTAACYIPGVPGYTHNASSSKRITDGIGTGGVQQKEK